jgi:hypothetical protein
VLNKVYSLNGVSLLVAKNKKPELTIIQDCKIRDKELFLAVSMLESGSWCCYCNGKQVIFDGHKLVKFS